VDKESVNDEGAARVVECAGDGPDEGFGDVHDFGGLKRLENLARRYMLCRGRGSEEDGERVRGATRLQGGDEGGLGIPGGNFHGSLSGSPEAEKETDEVEQVDIHT